MFMNTKVSRRHTFEITLELAEPAFRNAELLTVLGYTDGTSREHIDQTINEVLIESKSLCRVRGGYRLLKPVQRLQTDILCVQRIEFAVGPIIAQQLAQAEAIALCICTIGDGLEKWAMQLMSQGDYFKGYIVDAAASLIVDRVMQKIEHHLEQEQSAKGFKISNLFSPGNCGWHVSQQQQLFSLLPEQFCGIRLTESSLMVPIKSISGIIGIGETMHKLDSTCRFCEKLTCHYRHRFENILQDR